MHGGEWKLGETLTIRKKFNFPGFLVIKVINLDNKQPPQTFFNLYTLLLLVKEKIVWKI